MYITEIGGPVALYAAILLVNSNEEFEISQSSSVNVLRLVSELSFTKGLGVCFVFIFLFVKKVYFFVHNVQ